MSLKATKEFTVLISETRDQTAMGLPFVASAVFLIAGSFW
jgi:hypothetical protein